ncbi:MAG: signal peptidase [Actinomycetota bacterium]|jgi:signal peptidase I|nr:signal peptidase [Actinomycetota bacterium]
MEDQETQPGDAAAEQDEGPPRDAEQERSKHRPFWREVPVLIVIAFLVALLIKTFVLQAFFIPSGSMIPTLQIGDRVLVEKVSYLVTDPHRGNVVVFEKNLSGTEPSTDQPFWTDVTNAVKDLFGFPTGNNEDLIKRVIAVGGDTVVGKDGRVFVNDKPLDEPYLPAGTQTSPFGPVQVPPGRLWVMGDNRGNSDDSRNFGTIPESSVVGRAFVLVWPPSDFGSL